MIINKNITYLILIAFFSIYKSYGQQYFVSLDTIPINLKDNKINIKKNSISGNLYLENSFRKLTWLKQGKINRFSVVHIGDSHLQSGFFSENVRINLQYHFGDGGRGLIFPYNLAKSNSPDDYIFKSDNRIWTFNRLAHPEINVNSGISGFIVQNADDTCNIKFELKLDSIHKNGYFNTVKLFADTTTNWSCIFGNEGTKQRSIAANKNYNLFHSTKSNSNFILQSDSVSSVKIIYGLSLESDSPGVIYHTIGVNGAKYQSYNLAPNFWGQLSALESDLYIVSLGTNEAQKVDFDKNQFYLTIDSFVKNLLKISPNSEILLTTAPDSYFNDKSNKVLQMVNATIKSYAVNNNISLWDLYEVTNGYQSCYSWNAIGIMSKDRIHYKSEGYRFHGRLLYNAFISGYNQFIKNQGY